MQVGNQFKSPVSLLLSALLIACFCHSAFRLLSTTQAAIGAKTDLETKELLKVLKNVALPDRTVILTTLNEAWAAPGSMIDLFLESFRIGEGTDALLNHLLIVALDRKAFDRCKSIHPHCYYLSSPGVDFSAEKRFMSPDYLKMMWRRIHFLGTVLQLGYSFVFTDADIMWFRNPFKQFSSSEDMFMASDIFMGDATQLNNMANGGFNYVRSHSLTIEFYKYWYMAKELYPGFHDQAVFNEIKWDGVMRMGLKLRFLDTAHFGGFCQPAKDLNKVYTMHANCCVGIERKLNDLRLVLEDWRDFKMLNAPDQHIKTNFTWRAPSACKVLKNRSFQEWKKKSRGDVAADIVVHAGDILSFLNEGSR